MAADKPYRIGLEKIESSNLGSIGYDPEKQILAVQFAKSATVFHYAGITPEMALALYGAESKGKYYSTNIKGKFHAERMTGPCPNCGDEGYVGDKCDDCGTADYQAVPYTPKEKKTDVDDHT